MKKNFNKKPLIALFIIGLVVAIGGTIAYYTDVVTIPNIFGTKAYQTQVVETFNAPDNWLPGQTVQKVVTAKNPGDVEVAVRAKYVEKWEKKVADAQDPTQFTWTEFTPATNPVTITMDAGADDAKTWTAKQADNYYYYKTSLAAKSGNTIAETTPFISAVKLNDDAIPSETGDSNCTLAGEISTPGSGQKTATWTCGSSSDLNGARYTLTVTVETVQADAYSTVWSGAPTIATSYNN